MSDDAVVHPQWRGWVAENLARGATADELEAALVEEGVPLEHARACIREIAGSPGLLEARRLARRVAALEQMVRLRREHRDGAIERRTLPAAEEFRARYWVPGVPAVFTDLVRRWPAFERWSAQDFATRFGDVTIEACVGRTGVADPDSRWDLVKRTLTMREFVALLATTGNDAYVIAKNAALRNPALRPLLADIALPPDIFGPTLQPTRMGLWFGAAGTHTPLHHDGDDSMFCQVVGRKRFRLAPPESLPLLDTSRGVYSTWDPQDDLEGPEKLVEVVLQPGDALFIPAGWWHQVDALDLGISVSILAFAWPNDSSWYRPGSVLAGRGA